MDKIKILELTDAYYPTVDGTVNAVHNYAKELNKITCCKVAAPTFSKKSKYVEKDEFEVIRCKNSIFSAEKYKLADPTGDQKFVKKVESEKFDILHTHSPFSLGGFAVKSAKKQKIPVVATLHTRYYDDIYRIVNNDAVTQFILHILMEVYKKADSVWTVSDSAREILREYGYKGNVEVVRNGTEFVYPENADELIEKVNKIHNLYGQKNVFLFVGRMAMYKNLKLICDSLKILKDKGQNFKMLFVGGGFDLKQLKEYIKKIGIDDVCITTGDVGDRQLLQGYYLRANLLLFPSVFDTSGIVKVEAAAHKLASLLIKDSCSAEQVVDGENGFLSEENAESYADKILEIISNTNTTEIVGENAYKTLYRSWQTVAEEVYEKYQKVIEEFNKKRQLKIRTKAYSKAKKQAKATNKKTLKKEKAINKKNLKVEKSIQKQNVKEQKQQNKAQKKLEKKSKS